LILDVAGPCGDFVVDTLNGEQCDDGNWNNNDGCSSICSRERCGDGVRQNNEICDDGNVKNGDSCRDNCFPEWCGDNMIDNNGVEQCDDGNTSSNDGCSSTCQ